MSERIAVYAGSFDPYTKGHHDVVKKAALIFDRVVILVAKNEKKSGLFSVEQRERLIQVSLMTLGGVSLSKILISSLPTGKMLVEYAQEIKAIALVRSMRAVTEFEEEIAMAHHNQMQAPSISTIFVPPDREFEIVSSSAAKTVANLGGRLDYMVAPAVEKALREKFKK